MNLYRVVLQMNSGHDHSYNIWLLLPDKAELSPSECGYVSLHLADCWLRFSSEVELFWRPEPVAILSDQIIAAIITRRVNYYHYRRCYCYQRDRHPTGGGKDHHYCCCRKNYHHCYL